MDEGEDWPIVSICKPLSTIYICGIPGSQWLTSPEDLAMGLTGTNVSLLLADSDGRDGVGAYQADDVEHRLLPVEWSSRVRMICPGCDCEEKTTTANIDDTTEEEVICHHHRTTN